MLEVLQLTVDGVVCLGIKLELGAAPLVVIKARKGFVMCGYLNVETSERLGDVACMVRGVKDVGEMLSGEVAAVTKKAMELGIKKGMQVRDAIRRLG